MTTFDTSKLDTMVRNTVSEITLPNNIQVGTVEHNRRFVDVSSNQKTILYTSVLGMNKSDLAQTDPLAIIGNAVTIALLFVSKRYEQPFAQTQCNNDSNISTNELETIMVDGFNELKLPNSILSIDADVDSDHFIKVEVNGKLVVFMYAPKENGGQLNQISPILSVVIMAVNTAIRFMLEQNETDQAN